MATLEIHDESGAVEHVTIRREQPVVFGADPKCDVRLKGPGVLPFHGRIGWKGDRYRVEAFPESKSLDFNGKQVISASFRAGDEVRVGGNVIYMASAEDQPNTGSPATVQPRAAAAPATATATRAKAAPATPAKSAPAPATSAAAQAPAKKAGFLAKLAPKAMPPGEERILSSPLVLALVLMLMLLSGAGLYLWKVIRRTAADQLYAQAVESLEQGSYKQAHDQFKQFLDGHTDDARVSKARVLYNLADVRQFASGAAPSWTVVLEKTRKMIDSVGKLKEYDDEKTELGEIVLMAAEGLADRTKADAQIKLQEAPDAAKDDGESKPLKETEGAIRLLTAIVGKSAEKMKEKSKFPVKFAEAQAVVAKAKVRRDSLLKMDKALEASSAVGVYQARDELLLAYADLINDSELLKRIGGANELIRKATKFDPTTTPGQATPRPEPLGPPTTFVLRQDPGPAPTASAPLVYALAAGFAFALDGSNGAPVWQVPVGLTSPFPPQPVTSGGTPSVLAFDARYSELMRLNAKTGALIWRQEIGVPIADPPIVLGNQVVLASPVGRLTQIDYETGEVRGALDLGRKLSHSVVADESGKYLYMLGDEANLFVVALERNRMSCVGVEYTGHGPGSIPCAPSRIGRYLVVVENQTIRDGRWIVFLLDEDGSRARKVQQLTVSGWTWAPPPAAGKTIWSVGDRGGVAAYAIGPYDKNDPFRLIAELVPDAERSGPSYGRARSERELWRSSTLSAKFDLDADRGALNMGWTLQEAGPSLAPIQSADRLIVMTHQYSEGQGVAVWGVQPADGKPAWRTVLGVPWVSDPTPAPDGSGLTVAGVDGRLMTVSIDNLKAGGFVQQALSKPGSPKVLGAGARFVRFGETVLTFPSISSDHYLLIDGTAAPARVNLPEPLATTPVAWNGGLLIPAANGWVYWVDPKTGEPKADPYMPPFDRAKPIKWRTPVVVDDEAVVLADEGGRVHRLVVREEPRARLLAQPADPVDLNASVVADPVLFAGFVMLATNDDRVRGLAARDLGVIGSWKLESARSAGPFALGESAVVGDESGRILAFGKDGQTTWTAQPDGSALAGAPVSSDGAAWFLGRDGEFRKLSLNDGAVQARLKAEFLPPSGLLSVGDQVVVPVAPGIVRLLLPATP